jgi:glycosyltransferase involved in cell wall biosynthesis
MIRVTSNLLTNPENTGPGNFGRRLAVALKPLGVDLFPENHPREADLYLGSAYLSPGADRIFKGRCILRIDGLIPDANAFRNSSIHIYQSEYSRDILQQPHNYTHPWSYVIYNGVETQSAFKYEPSEDINLVSIIHNWNEFRYKVFMDAIIDNADAIQAAFPNLKWHIVGKSTDFFNAIQRKRNVPLFAKYVGFSSDLDEIRESSCALLHLVQKDACPNSVVESMMRGLPVIGWADSAGPELIKNGGVIIENTDAKHIIEQIQDVIQNRQEYSFNARKIALEQYDINTIAQKYKKVFEDAMAQNYNRH